MRCPNSRKVDGGCSAQNGLSAKNGYEIQTTNRARQASTIKKPGQTAPICKNPAGNHRFGIRIGPQTGQDQSKNAREVPTTRPNSFKLMSDLLDAKLLNCDIAQPTCWGGVGLATCKHFGHLGT